MITRSTAARLASNIYLTEYIEALEFTARLYVSPDGDGTDGSTWEHAYTTLNAAIAVADDDVNEFTMIFMSAGTFDVNIADRLVCDRNVYIKGVGMGRTIITNSHTSNTYVLGAIKNFILEDVTIYRTSTCGGVYLNSTTCNPVINNVEFDFASEVAAVGNALVLYNFPKGYFSNVIIYGDDTNTVGVTLNISDHCFFSNFTIKDCPAGIYSNVATNDSNTFRSITFDSCAIGLDLNDGDNNKFIDCIWIDCTLGIDIEAVANDTVISYPRYNNNTTDISDAGTGTSVQNIHVELATVDAIVDAVLIDTATTIPSMINTLNDLVSLQSHEEQVIYVAKNGNNTDGLSWATAWTSMASAITQASGLKHATIHVGKGIFDIASATYLLVDEPVRIIGAGRGQTIFKNSLGTATSDCVFRCTARVHLSDFSIDRGSVIHDGIKLINVPQSIIERVDFLFSGGVAAGRAIYIDSSTGTRIKDITIRGDGTNTIGIYGATAGGKVIIEDCYFHQCASGIEITIGTINRWHVKRCDFIGCIIGINMDDGDYFIYEDCNFIICTMGVDVEPIATYNTFIGMRFAGNTTNLDDDSTTSSWLEPCGCFSVEVYPADLTGITVPDGAANVYGTDTEILPAATATKPFIVTGFSIHAEDAGHHSIRFSADSGATFFAEVVIDAAALTGQLVGHNDIGGIDRVFPRTTRISASWKSSDGNSDVNKIWITRRVLQ